MRTISLKLIVNKRQTETFTYYLEVLSSLHNWVLSQRMNKDCYNWIDLCKKTTGHARRIGVNSQVFQQTIINADRSFTKYRKGLTRSVRFKSSRNRLKSFVFPQIKIDPVCKNKLNLPSIGYIKFHKQSIPDGKIKQVKIIKRASGWYALLIIDTKSTFSVKNNNTKVGIDTGFKTLATLSDGTKYENSREFIKEQTQLAKHQRGGNKKKVARLYERIANRRKDWNHKISRQIVENYSEIYITNDNIRSMAKVFGKSVSDAGISQLRTFIQYKGLNNGRIVKLVESKNTTRTCSSCGSLTGPTGLHGLNVRDWVCSACGAHHDRDINAAVNILNLGLGFSLVNLELEKSKDHGHPDFIKHLDKPRKK